jgi:solute carrier family 10 (sodium/bile acid cotransporter), member 7
MIGRERRRAAEIALRRLGRLLPDPLVRLLLLAILLASLLPVHGAGRQIAQTVSDAAIFLLFLLNGLRLPRDEVLAGIGNWRLLLPLTGWVFGGMLAAGWSLSHALAPVLPEAVALGFLFLGALPSTVQSATAYSSLAGGNVAGAVIAAALLNILGVFVSAPLFSLLSHGSGVGVSAGGLGRVAAILLLPFVLGQVGQHWASRWVGEHRLLTTWMDRTSIAIAVYVAVSGAVAGGLWRTVGASEWALLAGGVGVLLALGFAGAWQLGRAAGLDRPNRITMLFAGAHKSIAMGAPLASVLFAPSVAGMILLPALLYHLAQLVISAPLATRLADRP